MPAGATPRWHPALEHAKKGCENVYLMMCSYCVPEDGWLPIWHGGEMAYIFQNEDKVLVLNEAVQGQRYAQILSTLTVNFVKYGDPNNKYLPFGSRFETARTTL